MPQNPQLIGHRALALPQKFGNLLLTQGAMPHADEIGEQKFSLLESTLLSVPKLPPIAVDQVTVHRPERVMSIRDAMMSPCERVITANAAGRVLAQPSVACPPAVPIAFCGEKIDEKIISAFDYYGIKELTVVKE